MTDTKIKSQQIKDKEITDREAIAKLLSLSQMLSKVATAYLNKISGEEKIH